MERTGEKMTLPARQKRVLDQIETILQARDPALTSLFASFARMTSQETMPKIEEIRGWLSRMLQPMLLIPLLAVIIVTSIVVGSFVPGPRCGSAPTPRGTGYVIAGKSGACSPGAGRSGNLGSH
jgi:hypothetical protein